MNEWRERLIVELKELTEKICKLRVFITSEEFYTLSETQCDLLRSQSEIMIEYADILSKRLYSS